MRTHKTEFPDCEMPAEILEALEMGGLVDTSWHNDVCPSFKRADGIGELWVDYADQSKRELPLPRYRSFGKSGRYVYVGNDINAAIETLLNFDKIPS